MKTAFLIAFGLALVGTGAWAMSDTHAAALSASPGAHVDAATPETNGAILPYGAMGHHTETVATTILPYGAMGSTTVNKGDAIPPYGVMHGVAAAPSVAILPYGAMGPRAAP
jgi:hypothetical protein